MKAQFPPLIGYPPFLLVYPGLSAVSRSLLAVWLVMGDAQAVTVGFRTSSHHRRKLVGLRSAARISAL